GDRVMVAARRVEAAHARAIEPVQALDEALAHVLADDGRDRDGNVARIRVDLEHEAPEARDSVVAAIRRFLHRGRELVSEGAERIAVELHPADLAADGPDLAAGPFARGDDQRLHRADVEIAPGQAGGGRGVDGAGAEDLAPEL